MARREVAIASSMQWVFFVWGEKEQQGDNARHGRNDLLIHDDRVYQAWFSPSPVGGRAVTQLAGIICGSHCLQSNEERLQ